MALKTKSTTGSTRPLIVAGVMSGTSADGIDIALCRITPTRDANASPRIKFLGHAGFPYPRAIRADLLRIMEGAPSTAAHLSRLNWRLGAIYADCIERAATKLKLKPALVGLHGQTIHHQTKPTPYLGAPLPSTWQIGEAAVLAERLRCTVVSDFRPADLAAGGQGAPLVPMLDYTLFRHPTRNRILLNLGGIANVTVIPAGSTIDSLLAFDTGPANMVIDALMQSEFGKPFDRNGAVAARGEVPGDLFNELWRDPYFAAPPPKSCGREQFGQGFVQRLKHLAAKAAPADLIAAATYLTSTSILEAISVFGIPHLQQHTPRAAATDLIAAGGGTRNRTLMSLLAEGLSELNISLAPTDSVGIPSQAKEAVAFALLAWLSYFGLPGNIPAATGASHPAILGKVSRA
ncbi:MAG TPA: anhydro-N-acetylmuramic acid kinase [Acidobacteriaceae bacterium]|nr:anhydro-N-acetylmuramic acid kinase [Acidobacteriaceae bacterium]